MVGEFGTGKAERETLRVERQHHRVPLVPLRDQPVVDVAMPLLGGENGYRSAPTYLRAAQVRQRRRYCNDDYCDGVVEYRPVMLALSRMSPSSPACTSA